MFLLNIGRCRSGDLSVEMLADLQPETISARQRVIRGESVRTYSEAGLLDG